MATFLERLIWSVFCGTALSLGACSGSKTNNPPEDAQADEQDLDTEQEEPHESAATLLAYLEDRDLIKAAVRS